MPSGTRATGVLLMAHGTPESADQMVEYLRLVRGGREPSAELVEEMTHNWKAIGGRSPLTDITLQQRDALRVQLAAQGMDVPVAVGMRNWRPFIADAIRELERCVEQLGLPGVQIGTHVGPWNLDAPELFPFFEISATEDPRGLIAALSGTASAAKIRTGGVTPEAFPTCEQVARHVLATHPAR